MKTIIKFILAAVLLTAFISAVSAQQIEVKIYLQRTIVKADGSNFDRSAYLKRKIDTKSPLQNTLAMLFSPQITPAEDKQNYYSSTFGMKFEGVVLKNGTATVKFSQPPNETNYGSMGSMLFAEAVEKTAKQFSTVKRVKICAIGETMIDSELETPFPRCK
ncbi:MAG TPA: GerMN domain-containing protein [Pyrinomonadaceae bacterium]|nr:GerMN domain-containing protein [Pyrinomonadaceae bacterium]